MSRMSEIAASCQLFAKWNEMDPESLFAAVCEYEDEDPHNVVMTAAGVRIGRHWWNERDKTSFMEWAHDEGKGNDNGHHVSSSNQD